MLSDLAFWIVEGFASYDPAFTIAVAFASFGMAACLWLWLR